MFRTLLLHHQERRFGVVYCNWYKPVRLAGSPTLLTSALDGGRWSAPRPGRFTPGKDPVPIVQEARWAPGPVWTSAENLAPTGIRSPDLPVRRESLYRLSYSGPPNRVLVHSNAVPTYDYTYREH